MYLCVYELLWYRDDINCIVIIKSRFYSLQTDTERCFPHTFSIYSSIHFFLYYTNTYIHTYIHIYIYTYIHTTERTHACMLSLSLFLSTSFLHISIRSIHLHTSLLPSSQARCSHFPASFSWPTEKRGQRNNDQHSQKSIMSMDTPAVDG